MCGYVCVAFFFSTTTWLTNVCRSQEPGKDLLWYPENFTRGGRLKSGGKKLTLPGCWNEKAIRNAPRRTAATGALAGTSAQAAWEQVGRSQLETRERFSLVIYLAFPFCFHLPPFSRPCHSEVRAPWRRENLPLVPALPGASGLFPSSPTCPYHSSHNTAFFHTIKKHYLKSVLPWNSFFFNLFATETFLFMSFLTSYAHLQQARPIRNRICKPKMWEFTLSNSW